MWSESREQTSELRNIRQKLDKVIDLLSELVKEKKSDTDFADCSVGEEECIETTKVDEPRIDMEAIIKDIGGIRI